jgi:flagellar biosynthesis component FlhA
MFKKFQDFAKQSELGMAFGLILILGVMIVPISPFL